MKKIKFPYALVSRILLILSISNSLCAQSLLTGLLQFAKGTDIDPINIIICHKGKIISTQKHNTSLAHITYEIPKYAHQNSFSLVITPIAPDHHIMTLEEHSAQHTASLDGFDNTIEYFKINKKTPYLFYTLNLIADNTDKNETSYHWEITQSNLDQDRRLPDDTIIVIYSPECISSVHGGSNLELPTVYINNAFLQTALAADSTESLTDDLIDTFASLELALLDIKTSHVPVKQKIHTDSCRVMIVDTII